MCSVRTPPEVHSHTIPVGAKNHLNSSLPGSGGRIGAAFVGDMHAFVEPQGHAIGQRDRIKNSDTKSGLRPFYPFSIRKKNKINQVNIIIYIHTYIHFPIAFPFLLHVRTKPLRTPRLQRRRIFLRHRSQFFQRPLWSSLSAGRRVPSDRLTIKGYLTFPINTYGKP